MAFESLAYRYTFSIDDFPQRWLPLISLYDPDLPLYPIYYFHVIPDGLEADCRLLDTERAFGYVERINSTGEEGISVTIVLNKNMDKEENRSKYLEPVIRAVKERLGILNPVSFSDVNNVFESPYDNANSILKEIWYRVIANAFGNMLPFGRLWDEVLGLTRFVSSWNSPSGRKSELIQTHYFVSRFGVKIQCAGDIPQIDFYLLPTIHELIDKSNPLQSFPHYASLVRIANAVQARHCSLIDINGIKLSSFKNPNKGNKAKKGRFDKEALMTIYSNLNMYQEFTWAVECFNSFDKGAPRTIMFLMMLDDIRSGRLKPANLNASECGSVYDKLGGAFQSPKVIEIYAQQCYGNTAAAPIDTWIETFFKWPLSVYPTSKAKDINQNIFSHSVKLGKVERMLWTAAQARKVHSSACDDILWCTKYSSDTPRGANPLACNICLDSVRNCCPAFDKIRNKKVCFNCSPPSGVDFVITTDRHNNVDTNQKFVKCEGPSIYSKIVDESSPADVPNGFAPYPHPRHNGKVITVEDFVNTY